MDRRVKERLIGASILVALVVLVVPELLSGPKPAAPASGVAAIAPEPTRNVTVDLTTSKAPASETEAPAVQVLDAAPPTSSQSPASSVPAPPITASSTPSSSTPVPAAPTSARAAPARVAAAAVETATPSPTSSRAAWAVQLGSFASRANADNLSRKLKGQGFPVYVLPGGSGTSVRYRVRVGPLADRDSAERTQGKLKSIGQIPSLVPPAG
jgi:DedD protein